MSKYVKLDDVIQLLLEWADGYGYIENKTTTAIEELKQLPAVEPLTDKEQRIFLAAMGRELDICRAVDRKYEDCREPYEDRYKDSLVYVCQEIKRKVKRALWR